MISGMASLIRLKVHPGAKEDRLVGLAGGGYEAWVRADAEAGRANEAVLDLLAGSLGIERKRLRLFKGARSRSKLVQVLGDPPARPA
jgi:uncharacterized protein YggU (UPF0235/DUF167 family)